MDRASENLFEKKAWMAVAIPLSTVLISMSYWHGWGDTKHLRWLARQMLKSFRFTVFRFILGDSNRFTFRGHLLWWLLNGLVRSFRLASLIWFTDCRRERQSTKFLWQIRRRGFITGSFIADSISLRNDYRAPQSSPSRWMFDLLLTGHLWPYSEH